MANSNDTSYQNHLEELETRVSQLENYHRAINRVQAIAEFDHAGNILHANNNFLTIFGYTSEEIIGRHHSIFVDDEYAKSNQYEQFWTELREGILHAGEFLRLDKQGNEIWLQASYNPILDASGKLLRFVKYANDITSQKKRNADYESIAKGLHYGLLLVEFDLDGIILDASNKFLELVGYKREELIGQHHGILCFEEELNQPEYKRHWESLKKGQYQSKEFIRRNKSGEKVHIFATYNPIFDPRGNPIRIMKFVNDLSERVAIEEALRKAIHNADIAVKSKNQFLANMSHEIRTPMNAIIGYTEMMLEENQLSEDQRKSLNTIHFSSHSLLRLLNDILDSAKMESGSVELELESFSLFNLCRDVRDTLLLMASQKGLEFRLNYQEGLSHTYVGDAYRLQQVLVNLLGNAIKFTDQGFVELSVTGFGSNILIAVKDSGIGIEPSRIPLIFNPFTQAEAEITRKYGGTGLGTTISQQLVRLMGGEIHVESQPGVGSTFKVLLPLQQAMLPADTDVRQDTPASLSKLRILTVDDLNQNNNLLAGRLFKLGHEVIKADNGELAYDHVKKGGFDIVLMDLHMPGIDGCSAARLIRQWESRHEKPATPIIALSASIQAEDRLAAQHSGMNGFCPKPVDMTHLMLEIKKALSEKR